MHHSLKTPPFYFSNSTKSKNKNHKIKIKNKNQYKNPKIKTIILVHSMTHDGLPVGKTINIIGA